MASYYRWSQKNITYTEVPTYTYAVGTPTYCVTSKPPIINGQYYFTGGGNYSASYISNHSNLWFKNGTGPGYSNTAYYSIGGWNEDSVVYVNGYAISAAPGTFNQYVYSTNISEYPNGGSASNFWYDERTEINIDIITPSLAMQEQNLTITWSNVPENVDNISYIIQRNVNNTSWETIQSSTNLLSYTDNVESNWNSVQYQIAVILNGNTGDYVQSNVISVVESGALVISGQDGDLGAISSNIKYTVSSNKSNTISLIRSVNNIQVVSTVVSSGFSYNIPIAELPFGTGTIKITATIENDGSPLSVTRTWTYYKTPINIPSTGGIAQLTQNGQNIWPTTIADAIQAPVYLGGNLNAALNKLGQAALYTSPGKPKYNQVVINLNNVSVGDEINLPYNGVMVPHIIVHIGNPDPSMYDASCDGVWVLRKDCIAQGQWNSTNVNTLAGSTIMNTMAGYVNQYDSSVSSEIKTVKIPYCIGGGSSTVNTLANGLECQIFPLSLNEVGISTLVGNYPKIGSTLSYFIGSSQNDDNIRIANFNNSPYVWFLRNILSSQSSQVSAISRTGSPGQNNATDIGRYRPCFILPITFTATYYIDDNNNVAPQQEYTAGGSITDIFGYDIPITQSQEGTYQGTGTFGTSTPSTLTLPFVPKFVCITNQTNPYIRAIIPYGAYGIVWNQNTATSTAISSFGLATTWNQDTITWYNTTNAQLQLNETGVTYNYVAFG